METPSARRTRIATAKRAVLAAAALVFASGAVFARDDRPTDLFTCADTAAARKAFKPSGAGGPPSVEKLDDGTTLALPCDFAGSGGDRAFWDRDADLDLRGAAAVRFSIRCDDPGPVASFTLYLASGEGWYAAGFGLPAGDAWRTVTLRLLDTAVEGRPAGFGAVRALRFSAWKRLDRNTTVRLRGFTVLGASAPVAVVRAESALAAQGGEGKAIEECAARTARAFEALALDPAALSDRDLDAPPPAGVRLLVFPLNPSVPDGARKTLIEFLGRGGRVLFFYLLPRSLAAATGIEPGAYVGQERPGHFARIRVLPGALPGAPGEVGQRSWNIQEARPVEGRSRVAARWLDDAGEDTGRAAVVLSDNAAVMTHVLLGDDAENKRRFLLALTARLVPELAAEAARAALERLGSLGPFADFDEAQRALASAAGCPPFLAKARARRAEGRRFLEDGKVFEALEAAGEGRAALLEAYCLSREPLAGEHRAFWCHDASGVPGRSWEETVRLLAENGFSAVIPNMLWGGGAAYPSDVLPATSAAGADPLAACVEACRTHGVACHVWKVNWNMGWKSPADFVARMGREGRTQVNAAGEGQPRWLCPSHPENQTLEVAAMLEVAGRYAVAGLHFDYIRYPNESCCFCTGCRARFEKALGRAVASWPREVLRPGPARKAWLEFRRAQIDRVVEAVSRGARRIRPGIRISAAVFPNWPADRDRIGQDWATWCERGWLDFVCPMDYTSDAGAFESMVGLQRSWAGKVPCYPGIGLSTWSDRSDVCRLVGLIEITRRLQTKGFTVFDLGAVEADEVLPRLGRGITRR